MCSSPAQYLEPFAPADSMAGDLSFGSPPVVPLELQDAWMSHPRTPFAVESLESRRLLSAVAPTNLEQFEIELINRARANPTAEAARYGINLNEGLAAGTISTATRQPLAVNPLLTDSTRRHSQWMLSTGAFSHTGSGGTDPGARMKAAGYTFSGTWSWGENIAWQTFTGSTMTAALASQFEKNLFVDTGIAGRGHRLDILNANFREAGTGPLPGPSHGSPSAGMLTTDFASTAGNPFLTGVAYTDAVTRDHFYTPGEGLGGVTVLAKRAADG